jgi:hypothetical protein
MATKRGIYNDKLLKVDLQIAEVSYIKESIIRSKPYVHMCSQHSLPYDLRLYLCSARQKNAELANH